MEHDATQYATISMQMLENHSFLQIYWRDVSYLDKPPLVFWMSALSFKLFDVNHFAYRLPSFLVLLIGVYSTWRLVRRIYDLPTANLTVVIFMSTQAVFLITHDVRTDTMLVGWLMFAIWQLYVYVEDRNKTAFMLAFGGIGLAMLTKGPLGIVIPALAFGPQLILQKRWKMIFNPAWLLGILLVMLIISPMLYGLFLQHSKEGIEFYFWKQSFGRLTGENVWRDESSSLFFLHSFLWSFLPWTVPALFAFYSYFRSLISNPSNGDSFLLWVSVLVFVAMSNATYKLPHYMFVVYPYIAAMTARYYLTNKEKLPKALLYGQYFTLFLLIGLLIFLVISDFSIFRMIVLLAGFFAFTFILIKKRSSKSVFHRLLMVSLILIITGNIILNVSFYPKLLSFQSGGVAGRYVKKADFANEKLCFFNYHSPSFDFYSNQLIPYYSKTFQLDSLLLFNDSLTCFTNAEGLELLNDSSYLLSKRMEFKEYKATKLSLPYLFPQKREQILNKTYLVTVRKRAES